MIADITFSVGLMIIGWILPRPIFSDIGGMPAAAWLSSSPQPGDAGVAGLDECDGDEDGEALGVSEKSYTLSLSPPLPLGAAPALLDFTPGLIAGPVKVNHNDWQYS